MKITILCRHVSIDDKVRNIIEKKVAKLDKFFEDDKEALVTLRKAKETEILELTIHSGGIIFRSEVKSESYFNAIDIAVNVIERQIRKNKTRLEKKLRETAFDKTAGAENEPEEVSEEDMKEGVRVRTKNFTLKPMTPDEAIMQMNLLAHSFFVFKDSDTSEICIVYRRDDGDYGLIVTEK